MKKKSVLVWAVVGLLSLGSVAHAGSHFHCTDGNRMLILSFSDAGDSVQCGLTTAGGGGIVIRGTLSYAGKAEAAVRYTGKVSNTAGEIDAARLDVQESMLQAGAGAAALNGTAYRCELAHHAGHGAGELD